MKSAEEIMEILEGVGLVLCESSEGSIMVDRGLSRTAASRSDIAENNGVVTAGQPCSNPALNDGERVRQNGKTEITEYKLTADEFRRALGSETPGEWLMFGP